MTGPTEPSSSAVETAKGRSVAADYTFVAVDYTFVAMDYTFAAERIHDSNSSYRRGAGCSKIRSPVAADRTNASCHG